MNKAELTERMASELGVSIREASSMVNTIINSMSRALIEHDSIEIRGFGSFTVKEYEPYTGRNPKTGAKIQVAAKRLPFFKVGKDLRERVNQNLK